MLIIIIYFYDGLIFLLREFMSVAFALMWTVVGRLR